MQRRGPRVLALPERDGPKIAQRLGHTTRIAQLAEQRQTPFVAHDGLRMIALRSGQQPGAVHRLRPRGAYPGITLQIVRCVEQPLQAASPLAQVPAHVPEGCQGTGKPQRRQQLVTRAQPAEGRAQVVMLDLQPGQPRRLVRPNDLGLGLFRQSQVVQRMRLAGLGQLLSRQALEPILPDRLKQREARLSCDRFCLLHKARVHERFEARQHVAVHAASRSADCFHGGQRAAPAEYHQPVEQGLFCRVEQVVAPGDGRSHCPLPGR